MMVFILKDYSIEKVRKYIFENHLRNHILFVLHFTYVSMELYIVIFLVILFESEMGRIHEKYGLLSGQFIYNAI